MGKRKFKKLYEAIKKDLFETPVEDFIADLAKYGLTATTVPKCPVCSERMRIVNVSEDGWLEGGGRIPVSSYYWTCGCNHKEMKVLYENYFEWLQERE